LAESINSQSNWATATGGDDKLPAFTVPAAKPPHADDVFAQFTGGDNGASGANYQDGLDALLNVQANIIVAAGQDNSFGNALDRHCQLASNDTYQSERIAITGSKLNAKLSDITSHNLASDRVVFVAPGIQAVDDAGTPPADVTLPGSFAAAAVAGLLSSFDPEVSLTNKVLAADGLETVFSSVDLTALVQARVMALESRNGFRVVKGITTSTDTAFAQVSIRRIVDYAKQAVRLAAGPYIGLLNNEKVRAAMKATISNALEQMLDADMLEAFEVDVTATRPQEIAGIAVVTITLQPTFSIDFIQVTMILQ